jgi:hypothetical protein
MDYWSSQFPVCFVDFVGDMPSGPGEDVLQEPSDSFKSLSVTSCSMIDQFFSVSLGQLS